MNDMEYLRASDGLGEPAVATVIAERVAGDTTLKVSSTQHFPQKFIASSGMLDQDGYLMSSTLYSFYGQKVDETTIKIVKTVNGYIDTGNSTNQKVVIKPTSEWANQFANIWSKNFEKDGSLKYREDLKGQKGDRGTDGTNGKTAYELAVDNGFLGSEAEWIASLKGEKGDTGVGIKNITSQNSTVLVELTDDEVRTIPVPTVKGDKGDTGNTGDTGVGIRSVQLTENKGLDFELTDGTHLYTDSVQGPRGEQGPGGGYDDQPIIERITALEQKPDNDTIYNDTALKNRLSSVEINKADIGASYTKAESDGKYSLTAHTHAYSALTGRPVAMSSAEANTGTANHDRLIRASVLKGAIQTHQIQPDWNATSGKGAILNKPTIPQVDVAKKFVANVEVDSSPDEQNLILTKEGLNGSTEEVRVDLAEFISSLNIPIPQKPIYGMVRGRIGGAAQVMQGRVTVDMQWDESRKIEQNIQFLGSADSNAWLIPEDGIYTLTASTESVDIPNPFSIFFQRKTVSGTWNEISPEMPNSYPANGRGQIVSTTQHFYKGEKINVRVVNLSDGPTRIGEHDHRGHAQCYYTITRVATFGMDTVVSARPYNRLVKKINARVNIAGGANNTIKFSFDVPAEFKGRKFKATFKFIYDYKNLNNTDKPRAVTEVYRKDWNGTSYIVDKLLFSKHSNGFHNYFELTEVYENTSTLQVMDIFLRDRDNTSPTQSGSTDSAVILETID